MRMPYAYAMPLPARAKSRGFRNRVRPPCRGCHGAALAQARRARRLCARRRVKKSAMVQSLQQGNRGVGAITTGARPCLIYFVMPYPFAVPYLCAGASCACACACVCAAPRKAKSWPSATPALHCAHRRGTRFWCFFGGPCGGLLINNLLHS